MSNAPNRSRACKVDCDAGSGGGLSRGSEENEPWQTADMSIFSGSYQVPDAASATAVATPRIDFTRVVAMLFNKTILGLHWSG